MPSVRFKQRNSLGKTTTLTLIQRVPIVPVTGFLSANQTNKKGAYICLKRDHQIMVACFCLHVASAVSCIGGELHLGSSPHAHVTAFCQFIHRRWNFPAVKSSSPSIQLIITVGEELFINIRYKTIETFARFYIV